MSSEGQFPTRAEDAHRVVRLVTTGGSNEGGFGQIGPVGESLHLICGETGSIENYGYRVAERGCVGEDIDLGKATAIIHN
jgi:hypothetical protein